MESRSKGIFYILLAAFSFTVMNLFVRLAGEIPAIQKSFFRNLISLLVTLYVLRKEHLSFRIARRDWPHLLGRSVLGTVGIVCNFYAVDHMLLSDASMLNKMSPFFTVIFSYMLLKEPITITQIFLFLSAFAGSLLILKPSSAGFASPAALIALLGGLCAGWAYAELRVLGKHKVDKSLIIFVFSLLSTLAALPVLLFDYTPMSVRQLLLLIAAGIAATCGQFGVTVAYSCAPASEISIFDYFQIIFSALAGYFCFGQLADHLSFLGYLIICGAAVLMAACGRKSSQTL